MTHARVKPAGWTDDVDTITAAEANALDINITRSVDGNAGGAYNNSAEIRFQGAFRVDGAVDFNGTESHSGAVTFESTVTLSGTGARVQYRGDTTADATATISAQLDYRWVAAITANRTLTLSTATAPVPLAGNAIRIRAFPVGGGFTLTIACQAAGNLATLSGATAESTGGSIEVVFNGTRWIVVDWLNFALTAAGNNAA